MSTILKEITESIEDLNDTTDRATTKQLDMQEKILYMLTVIHEQQIKMDTTIAEALAKV